MSDVSKTNAELIAAREAIMETLNDPIMKLVLERDPHAWSAGLAMKLCNETLATRVPIQGEPNDELIAEARESVSRSYIGKPTARELDKAILMIRRLADTLESATRVPEQGEASAAIERVRAIHQREVLAVHPGIGEEAWCPACQEHWPCSTVAALDGAPEPEWEYGEIGPANQVHMTTPERVRKSEALGWSQEIVRRYTAGPWVSVKVGDIGE